MLWQQHGQPLKKVSSAAAVPLISMLPRRLQSFAKELSGDERTGANVVLKALEAPLFHISANAGLEGAVIINKVRESEPGVGFDALNEVYVNMVDAGIIDPAKVTRSALQECDKRELPHC